MQGSADTRRALSPARSDALRLVPSFQALAKNDMVIVNECGSGQNGCKLWNAS